MKPRYLLLIGLWVCWVVRGAHATTLVRLSLEQLSQAASEIVHARVVSQESRWNAQHTRIITLTTFALDQTVKGHPPSILVIEQPGGTVGNIHVRVAGTVRFRPEVGYVLFLEPAPKPARYLLVGMMQGAFRVYRDDASRQDRVLFPLGALNYGTQHGQEEVIPSGPTLPLEDFQQKVTAVLRAQINLPRGTSIPLVIQSTESGGAGRRHVLARTTSDVFPNAAIVIPAGSFVEGTANRVGGHWIIHWDELSVRGR